MKDLSKYYLCWQTYLERFHSIGLVAETLAADPLQNILLINWYQVEIELRMHKVGQSNDVFYFNWLHIVK